MANKGFRDFIKAISPPWLSGGVAERFLYTLAMPVDLLLQKLDEGVHARMPGFQADPSALALQGADRLIDRGFAEPDATYARRLQKALDSWAHAGSALAELQAILGYIYPESIGVRLISNTTDDASNSISVWYSLDPGATSDSVPRVDYRTDGNFNWDGVYGPLWWRTWVVIYSDSALWSPEDPWGGGAWGDGGVWGLTATPGEIATLRLIVAKWKAKHSWCRWIIVSFNPARFDPYHASGGGINPDGTFANWSIYSAGLQFTERYVDARFIDGTPYQVVRGGAGSTIDTIGA